MSLGICAVIPARSGSKGVPGKNLRQFGGLPLLAHSIKAAEAVDEIDRILLSTDSPKIANVGVDHGADVPFLRPTSLSGDDSPVIDAVEQLLYCLRSHEGYAPMYTLLLQPTSPLRTAGDIEAAYKLLRDRKADAVVSVTQAEDHPMLCRRLDAEGRMIPFVKSKLNGAPRQKLPKAYILNGAIYLIKTDVLLATRTWCPPNSCAYEMPRERSVDIDSLHDFEMAERLQMESERFSAALEMDG